MKLFLSILTVVTILSLVAIPVFSQENKEAAPAPQEETQAPAESTALPATTSTAVSAIQDEPVMQPEEVSIYGEVKSTDDATSSVKLQYYDYDNDEEKATDIIINKDTKIENAADLHDIKQGDWIDAIYAVKDGKNIAKSVIVEKEDEEAPAKAVVKTSEAGAETQPVKTSATE